MVANANLIMTKVLPPWLCILDLQGRVYVLTYPRKLMCARPSGFEWLSCNTMAAWDMMSELRCRQTTIDDLNSPIVLTVWQKLLSQYRVIHLVRSETVFEQSLESQHVVFSVVGQPSPRPTTLFANSAVPRTKGINLFNQSEIFVISAWFEDHLALPDLGPPWDSDVLPAAMLSHAS